MKENLTILDIAEIYCMDPDDLLKSYQRGLHIEIPKIDDFMHNWKAGQIVLENLANDVKYYDKV